MLRIHNSLTGRKEEFAPLERGHVRMYVCGITVYDYIHVGHARSQIAFDVVRRWLRASGHEVKRYRR
jgi:cysteinyl-tRNA synthetase